MNGFYCVNNTYEFIQSSSWVCCCVCFQFFRVLSIYIQFANVNISFSLLPSNCYSPDTIDNHYYIVLFTCHTHMKTNLVHPKMNEWKRKRDKIENVKTIVCIRICHAMQLIIRTNNEITLPIFGSTIILSLSHTHTDSHIHLLAHFNVFFHVSIDKR